MGNVHSSIIARPGKETLMSTKNKTPSVEPGKPTVQRKIAVELERGSVSVSRDGLIPFRNSTGNLQIGKVRHRADSDRIAVELAPSFAESVLDGIE